MQRSTLLRIAAALGALGVVCGAFGAHGLEGRLPARDLEIWNKAVHYQLWHALALVGVAALWEHLKRPAAAGICFALGAGIFSGSLYALVLSGVKVLGAITPIGGVLMIVGWLLLLATR